MIRSLEQSTERLMACPGCLGERPREDWAPSSRSCWTWILRCTSPISTVMSTAAAVRPGACLRFRVLAGVGTSLALGTFPKRPLGTGAPRAVVVRKGTFMIRSFSLLCLVAAVASVVGASALAYTVPRAAVGVIALEPGVASLARAAEVSTVAR